MNISNGYMCSVSDIKFIIFNTIGSIPETLKDHPTSHLVQACHGKFGSSLERANIVQAW